MGIDLRHWKEVWEACPWATPFSSPLWHAASEEIEARDASFEWEGIITPLRRIKLARGMISGFESCIPGVPGGPIARLHPSEDKLKAYWQELNRRTKGRFLIHLRPDSPFVNAPLRKINIKSHILPVKERQARLSSHHRRKIKKAVERAGVKIKPGRREEDFEAYHEMYAQSLARWEKKPARIYTDAFFNAVREIMLPADVAQFFIAWQGRIPHAGALVIYGKNETVYWHGVTADNAVPGAAHLLHWKIAEDAERRGLDSYDFGPSPGLEGVERFKLGFGAEPADQVTVMGSAKLFSSYFLKRLRK